MLRSSTATGTSTAARSATCTPRSAPTASRWRTGCCSSPPTGSRPSTTSSRRRSPTRAASSPSSRCGGSSSSRTSCRNHVLASDGPRSRPRWPGGPCSCDGSTWCRSSAWPGPTSPAAACASTARPARSAASGCPRGSSTATGCPSRSSPRRARRRPASTTSRSTRPRSTPSSASPCAGCCPRSPPRILARGNEIATARGVIIADTKVEFGLAPGSDPTDPRVVLADEVLTPDSSRFWPAEGWEPGHTQPSYDKEFVREWLLDPATGWDRHSGEAPPPMPERDRRADPREVRRGLRAAHRAHVRVSTRRRTLGARGGRVAGTTGEGR